MSESEQAEIDRMAKALRARQGKPVKGKPFFWFSPPGTQKLKLAGQTGRIVSVFDDGGVLLVAVSFPKALAWVDLRDLELNV